MRASLSRPPGVGPVAHSKYRNRVRFVLDRPGLLTIHGEESAGSYVARVDPTKGRVLTDEIWRR
jgi:hypothetical protein